MEKQWKKKKLGAKMNRQVIPTAGWISKNMMQNERRQHLHSYSIDMKF